MIIDYLICIFKLPNLDLLFGDYKKTALFERAYGPIIRRLSSRTLHNDFNIAKADALVNHKNTME